MVVIVYTFHTFVLQDAAEATFKSDIYSSMKIWSEKAMAPHSSTLAWKISGTGEPGGLPLYGCKNSQQNISKLNPTTHKKYHTPQSSGIHLKFIRLVQQKQINQCDRRHKQKKRQKPHDHLNRCREKHLTKSNIHSW